MSEFSKTIAEWKKAVTIKYVRWNTAKNNLVCDVCRERNGKKFLINKIENLIPAHEVCRRWISPIVDENLFEKEIEKIWSGDD